MITSERISDKEPIRYRETPKQYSIAAVFFAVSLAITFFSQYLRAGWLAFFIIINFAFFLACWKAIFWHKISIIDPGIIFFAVAVIYTVIPLVTIELMGFELGEVRDSRLYRIILDDYIISSTISNANAICSGFGGVYLALRRPLGVKLDYIKTDIVPTLWILLISASAVQLLLAISGQRGASYGDEYLLIQALPTVVIQMINISVNVFYVSLFGIIIILLSKGQWARAAIIVGLSIALFSVVTGARTPIVLVFLGFLLCWDGIYRAIKPAAISIIFLLVIGLFTLFGTIRGGNLSLAGAFAQSEFMTVFVTAIDVRQVYLGGSSIGMNLTLFLSDLLRLIPQAFLPFEKFDPASWYVTEFYPQYAASGGGFAFGMLAEAALSGGLLPALFRGAALAGVLCIALNMLAKGRSLWSYIIYVWLMISIYQCFRDTTFTLLGRFTFQFLPALLLCVGLSALLRPRQVR